MTSTRSTDHNASEKLTAETAADNAASTSAATEKKNVDVDTVSEVKAAESVENLYTPAMLAELLGVSVRVVRRWQRLALLEPTTTVMQLPYFDYASLTIARQLAQWTQQGLSVGSIRKQLLAFGDRFDSSEHAQFPALQDASLSVDGKQLLLRRGEHLVESSGQIRMDFDFDETADAPAATLRIDEHLQPAATPGPSGEPELSLQSMVEEAIDAEDRGDLVAAIDWYRAALANHGPNADICFQVAELLYRQGDISGARERYFMAIELSPTMVEARANLGCVLAECGEFNLAIAAFEGTLSQHPEYADVHFHLARVLDDTGNPASAAEHWLQFLELNPDSPWADEARQRIQTAAPILRI